MAGIFAIFTLAMAAVCFKQRLLAMSLIFIGIILSLGMFWHHATNVLQINW